MSISDSIIITADHGEVLGLVRKIAQVQNCIAETDLRLANRRRMLPTLAGMVGASRSGHDPILTSFPVATPRKCHVPADRKLLAVPNVSSRN